MCKNELAVKAMSEDEDAGKDAIREDELERKETFLGYEMMWVDIIPMLGTEPKDLHHTKEAWYEKVTSMFAAKKVFKYLCTEMKPAAKELDGGKWTKFAKSLPDVIDGKRIKTTDLDLIFAAAKAKDQRRLKLDEFLNKALVALAGKRYPWLENTDGEGPACKEFIRQHIFKWDVCSDLVWEVNSIQNCVC